MAATLADVAALAADTVFRDRVRAALMRVCVQVIRAAQESESPNQPDKMRRDLAVAAIEDREVYTDRFAWMLASVPTVTAAQTDEQLVGATRTAVDYLARFPI